MNVFRARREAPVKNHRHEAPPSNQSLKNHSTRVFLVTGGAGFIGHQLCRTLLLAGHVVHVVDNFSTGRRENIDSLRVFPNFHFHKLDITAEPLTAALSEIPLNAIYHLACPTGVPNIEKMSVEMLLASSVGTLNVSRLAQANNATLLFTSSCEVYGDPRITPQSEQYFGHVNSIGPRSPYEQGKRFSETIIKTFATHHGLPTRIVRLFNVYGPGMSPHDFRVLPQFLNAALSGKTLTIYGDGTQTRTMTYIDDVVSALQLVMDNGQAGSVYNIGSEDTLTINDIAQAVIRATGNSIPIKYQPHFIEDHSIRQPSTHRLRALGWTPTVAFSDGLSRMIESWRLPT